MVCLLLAGCAGRGYTPSTMPAELTAQPIHNAHTVDLSKFAGPPVEQDLIGPGDVLEVSLAAGLDPDDVSRFHVRVGDNGVAMLPEIGSLHLAGMHLMHAEQQIVNACVQRGLYRQPHVTLSTVHQRRNRVTVVGAVEEPGIHELPRGSSYLLSAIVAAGGLAEDAGTKVEIRQPGGSSRLAMPPAANASGVQPAGYTTSQAPAYVCLDLAEAVNHGSQGNYLADGSVVTIERRQPPPVQVMGLVRKPQELEYPVNHGMRLLGALAQAGGVSSKVADKIVVLRQTPAGGGDATRITVRLRNAKNNPTDNLLLAPGDVVVVEQTLSTVALDVMTNIVRFGVGASVPLY